ncbi:MAG TPA: hypothetical protein VJ725_28035 [Thermoanaerobaculia bacterium]|nr:hypothetical protein [Thermoanaerobaculia bacterium]
MDRIEVSTQDGRLSFLPGETIEGTVSWFLDEAPRSVELRLFWYTEGKGDQDVEIVRTFPFEAPGAQDRRSFRLEAPAEPWSFSGKLISLSWALEAVAEPGAKAGRVEIVLSPTGSEVRLQPGV